MAVQYFAPGVDITEFQCILIVSIDAVCVVTFTGTIEQKRSKAIKMKFYSLKVRFEQKQFDYVSYGYTYKAGYVTIAEHR